MSRERELLKRVRDALRELKGTHYNLYWDIQSMLDQPEQDNIQYLLDQVARLTAENAMLKEKWSTPKPESEQQPEAWIVVNKETGYRTQVSHFPDSYDKNTFEVIPLYTSPPTREPLSDEEIDKGYQESDGNYYDLAFRDGVRFAEKHNGIGGVE